MWELLEVSSPAGKPVGQRASGRSYSTSAERESEMPVVRKRAAFVGGLDGYAWMQWDDVDRWMDGKGWERERRRAVKASGRFTRDYFLQSLHSLIWNGEKASYSLRALLHCSEQHRKTITQHAWTHTHTTLKQNTATVSKVQNKWVAVKSFNEDYSHIIKHKQLWHNCEACIYSCWWAFIANEVFVGFPATLWFCLSVKLCAISIFSNFHWDCSRSEIYMSVVFCVNWIDPQGWAVCIDYPPMPETDCRLHTNTQWFPTENNLRA